WIREGAGARAVEGVGRADGREIGNIVGHGVAGADGGLAIAKNVPGQPGPRTEVAQVKVIKPRVRRPDGDETVGIPVGSAVGRLRGSAGVEVRSILVGISERAVHVPAKPVTDGDTRADFPFVLQE